MKLKYLPTLLVVATAVFFLASCKKSSNTQGRYIPVNASVIVHVNAESVSAKLPWEEIKQNDAFKTAYADSSLSSFAKSALDNPENTGIDTKKDILFFMVKDSAGSYIAVEGTVKDAAKFKTYNTAALKNATASQKDGVQFLVNEKTTVSWDEKKFILITDAPDANQMNDTQAWMEQMEDKMEGDSLAAAPVAPQVTTRDGVAAALLLYNLPEKSSMANDEKFSELVNSKGDVHFWINAELLKEGTPAIPQLSMINLDKMYEGSIATGTLSFEDGKIDVDMKSYAGKEMTDIWKKYSGDKISDDMVKRLPAKNIAMLLAFNFKPEGIKEFLKLTGLDGFVNMGTAFLGFNLDDFVKANKGDILLAISDIAKDSNGKTNASVLFSASVGDKPSFDKLIAAGKKTGKQGLGNMSSEIYFNSNDKYFAIGNNRTNIDQFLAKEGSSKFDFYDKIAGSPIAGYVNFQYLMTAMRNEVSKDSLGLVALDASVKMWDNAIMSGGDFKDGGITQHFEINLVDKSTNSLKQLNKYIAQMAKLAEIKKKEKRFVADETIPVEDVIAMPQ